MTYIVKEIKHNLVYSGDVRDRDEITSDYHRAQKMSWAQAEGLCDVLNRLHGYRYNFQVLAAEELAYHR